MKKVFILLGLAAISSAVAVGVSTKASFKQAKADEIVKYYPIDSAHFSAEGFDDAFLGDNFNNLVRTRGERFWSGGSGWDEQERTFNALDNFADTIHRAGGEGRKGTIKSITWKHAGGDNKYVSFLLGGGAEDAELGKIYVDIYSVTQAEKVASNIQPAFDGREDLADGKHLRAPISCNMVLKFVEVPAKYANDDLRIEIHDDKTSSYGGVTFSYLKFNQTLEDVAKTFVLHRDQMKLNKNTSDWSRDANQFVIDYYDADAYYADLRTEAAKLAVLDNADDDFEDGDISDWLFDSAFSTNDNGSFAAVNCNTLVSNADSKDWIEKMPMNKTNDYFLNGDKSGVDEASQYRLYSRPFKLSGTGLISAKLGGNSSRIAIVNADTFAELMGLDNPSFVDASISNVMASGSRCNTMTRVYFDCSSHLNETVRIALSDSRHGGNWGLAYFDEVITKYTSLPSLKVDLITQDWTDGESVRHGPYHGYILDKYSGSDSTDFGKAFDFLSDYYGLVRNESNDFTHCSKELDLTALKTKFNSLSSDAKAVVNGSEDFDFKNSGSDWWDHEARKDFTVGDTLVALGGFEGAVASSSIVINPINNFAFDSTAVIIVVAISSIALLGFVVLFAKKKKQN